MKIIIQFLYLIALYGSFISGSFYLRGRRITSKQRLIVFRKTPWVTFTLAGLITSGLILQSLFPDLLLHFMRNTQLILKNEWWRIITALFFQDGGVVGGISNIIGLLFIGSIAEQLWSRVQLLAIFFGGGILVEIIALWWQPEGAGNSIANLCLAAGVAIVCLKAKPFLKSNAIAAISLSAGIPLLVIKDIHGMAIVTGSLVSIFILLLHKRKSRKKIELV